MAGRYYRLGKKSIRRIDSRKEAESADEDNQSGGSAVAPDMYGWTVPEKSASSRPQPLEDKGNGKTAQAHTR
jgi:hypothetical protein